MSSEDRNGWIEDIEQSVSAGSPAQPTAAVAVEAAETLLELRAEHNRRTLARIEALLDYAVQQPDAHAVHIAWTRSLAMIKLQLDCPVEPRRALDVLVPTFDMLQDPDRPEFCALLGLAIGNFYSLLKDGELEDRYFRDTDRALDFSRTYFRAQSDERLEFATFLFAQLKLKQLEQGQIPDEDLSAAYAVAGQLAKEVLEAADQVKDPIAQAGRYEIAGRIMALNPTGLTTEEAAVADQCLDRAYRCFREAGGQLDTSRCVYAILRLWGRAPPPMSFERARRTEEHMRSLDWAYTGSESDYPAMPPGLLKAAETWLAAARVSEGDQREAAFERAETLALRLAMLPETAADAEMRGCGWFVLGNAISRDLLVLVEPQRLAGEAEEEARGRLEEARWAFQKAIVLFEPSGTMGVRVRLQLAKTFVAQVGCCGDNSALDDAKAAWREAARYAADDDLLRCHLNLLSTLLAAAAGGAVADLLEARDLIASLAGAALGEDLQAQLAFCGHRFEILVRAHGEALAEADFSLALELAGDPHRRRAYLSEALERLPDYVEAQVRFLRGAQLEIQRDLALMRLHGVPESDPERWAEALHLAGQNSQMFEELEARDRQFNSGVTGKALVQAHLAHASPFILFLRSFDLETRFGSPPGRPRLERDMVVAGYRVTRDLVSRLNPAQATLLIVNRDDPVPAQDGAKLFLSNFDWRRMVFCLIAEAAVVVASIPEDRESLPQGISDELRAISALGALGRSVVITEPSLRFLYEPASSAEGAVSGLQGDLEAAGFAQLFREADVEQNPDAIVEAIREIARQPIARA